MGLRYGRRNEIAGNLDLNRIGLEPPDRGTQ